jgi:tripartite ATP-independent transporter DctM subunit
VSAELITVLMFSGVLVGVVFLGFPVAFTLGGLGFAFGMIFMGPDSLSIFLLRILGLMKDNILLAVPLFVLMGAIMERSGMAESLYDAMYVWLGGLRGGLAIATILICTAFAAATGVVGASVVTMGLIALPAMIKRGYNKPLAAGTVIAGGTLGIIIPPSIMLVVMAPLGGLSLGRLYMAAEIPGLMLSAAFVAYIAVVCWLRPQMGPPMPKDERVMPLGKKLRLLFLTLAPPIILIFAVLGAIFFGVTSPTEAAATGAFAALVLAAAYGRLNLAMIRDACYSTVRTTSMVLIVAVGAGFFTAVFLSLGGGDVIKNLMLSLPIGKWGILALMMFMLFILGMFIDWIGILFITFPLFLPVAKALGFDPIWFATLVAVNLQMSFLTPPFAFSIFYLKGISKGMLEVSEIMKGVVPFIALQAIVLLLVILFPEMALWLPGKMVK